MITDASNDDYYVMVTGGSVGNCTITCLVTSYRINTVGSQLFTDATESFSYHVIVTDASGGGGSGGGGGDFQYSLTGPSSGTYTLKLSGSGADIVIPNYPNYTAPWRQYDLSGVYYNNKVTEIGDYAFAGQDRLRGSKISDRLTRIGKRAFENCTGLGSYTFPDTLTELGEGAFFGAKLSSIALPEKLTRIEEDTFAFSSANTLALSPNVTYIGTFALAYNNFSFIELPKSLTWLGNGAFQSCAELETVICPDGLEFIDQQAFRDCAKLKSIYLPRNDRFHVISEQLFYNCAALEMVDIPENVTVIAAKAFSGCGKLSAVFLPDSIVSIAEDAFLNSPNVVLYCSANSYAAKYAAKQGLPVKARPDFLMADGVLLKYTGRDSLVKVPEDTLQIALGAFSGNAAIAEVRIPSSVRKIASRAFMGCVNLKTVQFASGIQEIGEEAFRACAKLQRVVLPESVSKVGNAAFKDCGSLRSVKLPAMLAVANWGANVFEGCAEKAEITLPVQLFSDSEFGFFESVILVPGTSTYLEDDGNSFKVNSTTRRIVISDGISYIGGSALRNYQAVESITVADSVREISYDAFNSCYSLKEIVLHEGLTTMKANAFTGCRSLEKVILPSTLATIASWTFQGCKQLKEVVLPEGLKTIDTEAFDGCASLEKVVLPSSLTRIAKRSFGNCARLSEVIYTEPIGFVNEGAFAGCPNLIHRDALYPVSPHCTSNRSIYTYAGDNPWSWKYSAPGAGAMLVRFSKETRLEGVAAILLRGASGQALATYKNRELAGKTLLIPGDAFVIEQSNEEKVDYYGFSIDEIKGLARETTLYLPASARQIEKEAFAGGDFETVILPASCLSVGARAFADNPALKRVIVTNPETVIASDAFENCPNAELIGNVSAL